MSHDYKPVTQATDQELKQARETCARITRRQAGNFYYAFVFLPKVQRQGIHSLYAFLRAGDDIADSEHSDKLNLLERLKLTLDNCYRGLYLDPVSLALALSIDRFEFPRVYFEEMFQGLEHDLNFKPFPSSADLELYCYRVASTVGLLCLKIFGVDLNQAEDYAISLGKAMQLTNILRDLKEDYDRNRIYLPEEDLHKYSIRPLELFAPQCHEQLKELVRWECEKANSLYAQADTSCPHQMRKKLVAAEIMGQIYKQILTRIENSDRYDTRIELTRREKVKIGYRVVSEFM